MSVELRYVQFEIHEWSIRNFGVSDGTNSLLGLTEEVGELAHAHLKGRQGIRHTPEEIMEKKKDAVADIAIYLLDYCAREGIELEFELNKTWEKVKQRDWKNKPLDAATGELG